MYFTNLFVLILYGTLALGWVLFYTEWFPVVGGLLGLGGLFAWLAFLGNVVSDNRKDEIQTFFDEKCLQRPWFFTASALIFVLFVVLMPLSQSSIVFDNSGTERTWRADMYPVEDPHTVTTTVIPARTVITQSLPVGFLGQRTYRLEVGDLPWLNREIKAFRRNEQLRLPDDFMQRGAILLRPHANILTALATRKWLLQITIEDGENEKVEQIDNYTGEAYWLGVSERVRPPASLELDWRLELKNSDHTDSYVDSWSNPSSISTEALQPGSKVCAVLIDPRAAVGSEAQLYSGEAVLLAPKGGQFVTTLTLTFKGAKTCSAN